MAAPQQKTEEEDDDGTVWSFGFGSNMNVDIVKNKKGVEVIEHVAGAVPGWTLSFTAGGIPMVEPAMGNCTELKGGELHGVALRLTTEAMAKMDKQEGYNPDSDRGYAKVEVTVEAYDGRLAETLRARTFGMCRVVEPQADGASSHSVRNSSESRN